MTPTIKAYFQRRLNMLEGQIKALRNEIGANTERVSADTEVLQRFTNEGALIDLLFAGAQGEEGPAWRAPSGGLWLHAGRAAAVLGPPWTPASVRAALAPVSGARRCYRGPEGTVHGIEVDMAQLRAALDLIGEGEIADIMDRGIVGGADAGSAGVPSRPRPSRQASR
jgi:hypothetical protein